MSTQQLQDLLITPELVDEFKNTLDEISIDDNDMDTVRSTNYVAHLEGVDENNNQVWSFLPKKFESLGEQMFLTTEEVNLIEFRGTIKLVLATAELTKNMPEKVKDLQVILPERSQINTAFAL